MIEIGVGSETVMKCQDSGAIVFSVTSALDIITSWAPPVYCGGTKRNKTKQEIKIIINIRIYVT